ncbi:MAG: TerB family tellurite resistance protein [Desulfobacteraceae bacterium]|jgi:uncharacterized tellurite resistance protein B-like protein
MIDMLKRIFTKTAGDAAPRQSHSPQDIRVAVCALCVEIARIDETFSRQELETLIDILTDKYDLSPQHAHALIAEADKELHESVDLWQFASAINENFSIDEKVEIMEILWRIVYVDGKMEPNEHYMMNKLSNLLRLSHKQMIDAKLKVLRE